MTYTKDHYKLWSSPISTHHLDILGNEGWIVVGIDDDIAVLMREKEK